ncbi:MAG TPA: hypothetical protein DDZ41_03635 [Flavobacterium sp.]|nr:hypothetical protein [Flavobacterium sp.]
MNRLHVLMLIVFLLTIPSIAQNVIKHKVVSGDSFYSLAKKYNVTESDLYELNPTLKGKTLQINTIIRIPAKATINKVSSNFHKVTLGESFYSIAKKYNLSLDDLKSYNPTVDANSLKIGTQIALVGTTNSLKDKNKEKNKPVESASSEIIHKVKKGETISQITEKYNVSFRELKKLNPGLDVKLQINDLIVIKKGNEKTKPEIIEPVVEPVKIISPVTTQLEIIASADDNFEEPDDSGEITHVVIRGETLNSISKKYKITLEKLKELNPKVTDKIFPGRKLIIKKGIITEEVTPVIVYPDIEEFVEEIAPPISEKGMETARQLIDIASEHLGTRYRSGGTKSGGFDCSGLMCYTFSQLNIKLPRTSNQQSRIGKKVSKNYAQKGDLIFFSTNGRGTVNHVGLITEIIDDEIFFIHSSVKRGVIVSSIKETYYARRFVRINRVLDIIN